MPCTICHQRTPRRSGSAVRALRRADPQVRSKPAKDARYYFNARFYDAERGAFIGRDPKLQFWTPYSYVGNGPLMGVDPDGEEIRYSMGCEDAPGNREVLLVDMTGVLRDETGSIGDLSGARDYIERRISESWSVDVPGSGKIQTSVHLSLEGAERAARADDHVVRIVGAVAINGEVARGNPPGAVFPIGGKDMQLTPYALSPAQARTPGHEFGHSMGLEHNADPAAPNIMWQSDKTPSMRVTPAIFDDIKGWAE